MTWQIIDRFDGPGLDSNLWIPEYLPHWTTPDRSRARYSLTDSGVELRIDPDQPAWRPRDGAFRVSHLQTGHHDGQHRIGHDLAVVSPAPSRSLWTARSGAVEVVASATAHQNAMLGIWLVGHEATGPRDSGEICIAEVLGTTIRDGKSTVRTGIKAHHDPRLVDEIEDVRLPMDATRAHAYGARWDRHGCELTVDGTVVHRSGQSLNYPLQLMIDLWDLPGRDGPAADETCALRATIHQVRLRADS